MRITGAVSERVNSVIAEAELEEMISKHRRETETSEEEALKKVEEAQHSNTQATFKMMDRHNDMVKKSQEIANAQAKKRAMERLAQKRAEEHSEMFVEMALRNDERRDLMEELRLKDQ